MANEEGAPTNIRKLQSVEKVMSYPIVAASAGEIKAFYNRPTEWIFSRAKGLAFSWTASSVAPYLEKPIAEADAKVVGVLEEIERRVPLVKEQPNVIAETAKEAVQTKINQIPDVRAAAEPYIQSVRDKTSETGSTLLGYGSMAWEGIGSGAASGRQLLGHYWSGAQSQTSASEAPPPSAAAPESSLWNKFFGKM